MDILEINAEPRTAWGSDADGGPSQKDFDLLAAEAEQGSSEAQERMLGHPIELRQWISRQKSARQASQAALTPECEALRALFKKIKPSTRFGSVELPQSEPELIIQYGNLHGKESRADFKSDVQGIEHAILSGSPEALREMVERSPMALWAMDFSLSEYEAENALAFASKYAPVGADIEIVSYLRSQGAKLPELKLNLVMSSGLMPEEGLWTKPPKAGVEALLAAGYEFDYGDGAGLLQKASFAGVPEAGAPVVARQKIRWLDELERRGFATWSGARGEAEWAVHMARLPEHIGKDEADKEFALYAKRLGGAGLGTWMCYGSDQPGLDGAWPELGPWLCRHKLANEALRASQDSPAQTTWARVLPWAQREDLETMLSPCFGVAAVSERVVERRRL